MTSNDEYVLTLLQEQGFLSVDQVAAAANSMHEGSETTLDVLVSSGVISQDDVLGIIAEQFGIKEFSVREHVAGIMAKLEASNRAEAVAIALRKHLL